VLVRGFLAALSPLLFGLYAWFPFLIFVPYVALVPWVLLYADDREHPASLLWFVPAAWLAWMLQYPGTLNFGWFVPPVMAAAMFVPWLAFPVLMRTIHRRFRWPRTVTVPIVWVSVEWIRVTCTLAHFDVFALGYSQARVTPLVQMADIAGVYGISFLVAAVNGWVADALVASRDARLPAEEPRSRPRLLLRAIAVSFLFVAACAYGAIRLARARDLPGPRLAVVQPNVLHNERNAIGVHLAQVIYTDEHVPASAADLIVWPENAILDNLQRPGTYLPDLARLARGKQALLLVGSMGKSADAPGRTTNSAFLIDGAGAIVGEARKRILFPWSEAVPADAFLRRVLPPLWRLQRALVREGWGFVPTGIAGTKTTILSLPWHGGVVPFAVLICVENTDPGLPSEAARRGARFLVNITSEREIGGPIQEQLLRVSMLRAVENRLAYVRCGNSGISAFIDPEGRVRSVLRGERGGTIFDRGVLVDRVFLAAGGVTLYARSHDAFALVCLVTTLALFARALLSRSGARRAIGLGVAVLIMAAPGCGPSAFSEGTPAGAAARLAEGRDRLKNGDASGAVPPLTAACATAASCREAIPLLVRCFRTTRRFEDAVDLFSALAERKAELRADALVARAGFLDRLSEWRDAERDLAEAARLDPRGSTFAALGALRLRMDRPGGALEAYAQALAFSPYDPPIRFAQARTLWLAGHAIDAERAIDALLSDDAGLGAAWAVKGRLREAAGDEPGAVQAFQAALSADPDNVEARFLLARRALAGGDLDQAKRYLAEIEELDAREGSGRRGAGEIQR
jgi:apolipoprotein N-acyltransferase